MRSMETYYVVGNLLGGVASAMHSVSAGSLRCVVIVDYCLDDFNLFLVGTLVKFSLIIE